MSEDDNVAKNGVNPVLEFTWVGGLVGNWQDATNWATADGQAATRPPGAQDDATIDTGADASRDIDGVGSAATLTLSGSNVIAGTATAQKLSDEGSLTLTTGATLSAVSSEIAAGTSIIAEGANAALNAGSVIVSASEFQPPLAGSMQASSGATIQFDSLDLESPEAFTVDPSSVIEIGTAGSAGGQSALEGRVTIDVGATLTMAASYGNSIMALVSGVSIGSLVDNGTISIGEPPVGNPRLALSTLSVGTLSGIGGISVGTTLSVGTIASGSLKIDAPTQPAGFVFSNVDINGGFASGNVIDFSNGLDLQLTADSDGGFTKISGTLANFNIRSEIELLNVKLTNITYQPGSGSSGTLSLFVGQNSVGSLNLTGDYSGEQFNLTQFSTESVITVNQYSFNDGVLDITTNSDHAVSLATIESFLPSLPTEVVAAGPGILTIDASTLPPMLQIQAGATAAVQGFAERLPEIIIEKGGFLTGSSEAAGTEGSISGNGTILAQPGTAFYTNGPVASGIDVQVGSPTFDGADGLVLSIAQPASFQATISGFGQGETVAIGVGQGQIVTEQTTSPTETFVAVTQDGQSLGSFNFAGDYSGDIFSTDLSGNITEATAPCYCSGTLILTPDGDRPVENLRIADLVTTASGRARPIKWIGSRSYGKPFSGNNPDIQPIRIARGALAEGVPSRDLLVSPLHAIYLEKTLVPAALLVNHRTIEQVKDMDLIEYFHVELESHDILIAEGAQAESFVDCDSRQMFANAAEFDQLYPADQSQAWAFCAPRIEDGPRLAKIQSALQRRAAELLGEVREEARPPVHVHVHGHLDFLDRERLSGWAWMPDFPDRAVIIEIADDDGVLGRTTANRMRADVAKAGFGSGRYGFVFEFPAPLTDVAPCRIHARATGDVTALQGSPRTLPGLRALTPDMLPALGDAIAAGATLTQSPISSSSGRVEAIDQSIAFLLRQVASLQARRDREARVSFERRKLALVIDDRAPDSSRDAGSAALSSHLQCLRRLGFRVMFAAFDLQPGVKLDCSVEQCTQPYYRSVEEVLRRHGREAAIVYLHRIGNADCFAALVRHFCPDAKLIYSVADLHFVRMTREAARSGKRGIRRQAEMMRRLETNLAERADLTITHSPYEADFLRQLTPNARIHVVPWQAKIRARGPGQSRKEPGMAFVGGWHHAPNRDAVEFLLAEILPKLQNSGSPIPCYIVGTDIPDFSQDRLPVGVRIVGHLPDLSTIMDRVRLTVAPLRFGAGIKGKVIESYAHGVPCIMTSIAAEGLPLSAILRTCVADDISSFVKLIRKIHDDEELATAVAHAGTDLVERYFSADAEDAALMNALAGISLRDRSNLSSDYTKSICPIDRLAEATAV